MDERENHDSLTFSEYELEIIRELLSEMSCGYKRETFYFDCCEANLIIKKIDGKASSEVKGMDTCYHGRIRCWECARVQELQERVQELEQAIGEALERMKHGGAGTQTYIEYVLRKALGDEE